MAGCQKPAARYRAALQKRARRYPEFQRLSRSDGLRLVPLTIVDMRGMRSTIGASPATMARRLGVTSWKSRCERFWRKHYSPLIGTPPISSPKAGSLMREAMRGVQIIERAACAGILQYLSKMGELLRLHARSRRKLQTKERYFPCSAKSIIPAHTGTLECRCAAI